MSEGKRTRRSDESSQRYTRTDKGYTVYNNAHLEYLYTPLSRSITLARLGSVQPLCFILDEKTLVQVILTVSIVVVVKISVEGLSFLIYAVVAVIVIVIVR